MHDFVAVGDITTDAFIKLKEANVYCDINQENCVICMDFAAKIPYESVTVVPAVGNSPNAAVAAARLGLKSALVANLGNDYHGQEAIAALKADGVDTDFIKIHQNRRTNYHYVLWYEDERTILVKHEDYPYEMPAIGTPKWLYLSSMGAASLPFHDRLADYLDKRKEIKLAFQPGTFQIHAGVKRLERLYRRAELFFCNRAEAQKILGTREEKIESLLEGLRRLGPRIIVVTDGKDGAYAADGDGLWFMPAYPDLKPPLERTGAGDAFSATFTAALALQKNVGDALRWGPINSMSVVQKIGAQAGLLSRQELEQYLVAAPAEYRPKKL